ncbi:MAG: RNA methyltransferase [Proteobacteria bacterium]|nr:RNA methyltransferase [Pseudomonadota bacterium]
MKTEQHSNIILKLTDVINDDRVDLLRQVLNERTRYLTVVLDDIYQPQNTSAILRSCECLGIQDLHVIEDKNDYKVNKMVVKGASKWVRLYRYKQQKGRKDCLDNIKNNGYKVVAMTLSRDSIPLEGLPVTDKLALCFGSEEAGLNKLIEANADYKVQIPITGFTQSYNVSVSAGISLYYLINKIKDLQQDWQLSKKEKETLLIDWLSKSTPTGKVLLEKYSENSKSTIT